MMIVHNADADAVDGGGGVDGGLVLNDVFGTFQANCVDCCTTPLTEPWYSAFEVQCATNGTWLPAHSAAVHRNSVHVTSLVPISGIRSGYGGSPDCLLYNGIGKIQSRHRPRGLCNPNVYGTGDATIVEALACAPLSSSSSNFTPLAFLSL